jgi:hypothetical protein
MEKHDRIPGGSGSEPPTRRRVRLHPREGGEHRFRFARRWETRRRAQRRNPIWLILTLDIGAIVLIYLLARAVIQRMSGS